MAAHTLTYKTKAVAKVIAGVIGFALAVGNQLVDVVPEHWKPLATGIIGALTAGSIFLAPYAPLPAKRRTVKGPGGLPHHPGAGTGKV